MLALSQDCLGSRLTDWPQWELSVWTKAVAAKNQKMFWQPLKQSIQHF